MKGFLEEYGKVVVVGIILMIFVVFASPISREFVYNIKEANTEISSKYIPVDINTHKRISVLGDDTEEGEILPHINEDENPYCDICEGVAVEYIEFEINDANYNMAGIELEGDVVIPEMFQYKGQWYKIIRIGKLFYQRSGVTNITIPEGVIELKGNAINLCYDVETIKLPSTLKFIDTNSIRDNISLKNVVLPEGLTEIGTYALAGNSSLKNINIPKTVKNIGTGAFYNTYWMNNIPSSVETIGRNAFANVPHITYYGPATWEEGNEYWGAKSMN